METMKAFQKHYILIFWLTLINVSLIDFITKRWAVMALPYHKNDGIAFGIDLPLWIQIMGSLIIIYMLINMAIEQFYEKKDAHYKMLLLGAIIGGGLGNLVDRMVNGFVIDFIVLRPFPTFNVADLGITVGLVLLFVTILMDQRKSKT